MRATDGIYLKAASASSGVVSLTGGRYVLSAIATWSAGSVKVQFLAQDGTTWVDVPSSTLTANGILAAIELPPGQYQLAVTTATGVYASLTRVPGE